MTARRTTDAARDRCFSSGRSKDGCFGRSLLASGATSTYAHSNIGASPDYRRRDERCIALEANCAWFAAMTAIHRDSQLCRVDECTSWLNGVPISACGSCGIFAATELSPCAVSSSAASPPCVYTHNSHRGNASKRRSRAPSSLALQSEPEPSQETYLWHVHTGSFWLEQFSGGCRLGGGMPRLIPALGDGMPAWY